MHDVAKSLPVTAAGSGETLLRFFAFTVDSDSQYYKVPRLAASVDAPAFQKEEFDHVHDRC